MKEALVLGYELSIKSVNVLTFVLVAGSDLHSVAIKRNILSIIIIL